MEFSPGGRRQLIELSAFSFGHHVIAKRPAGPAAEHVPNREVHQRMGVDAKLQGMADHAMAQHQQVSGDHRVGDPPTNPRGPGRCLWGSRFISCRIVVFRRDGLREWMAHNDLPVSW